MTQSKLIIPSSLKLGYQSRSDTYTGRLAYITYIDHTGKHRKEKSWQTWRDKKIEPEDYENEPIEGFVLNKKVGDYHGSWFESRRAAIRVYDPRGFEFEISVENLLFILQECSAIQGKGLEGKFVYAWASTDLILLPVSSVDYKQSMNYTNLQAKKITKKDMVPGRVYLNKDNGKVLYLGREDWYYRTDNFYRSYGGSWTIKSKKYHIFVHLDKETSKSRYYYNSEKGTGSHGRYWVQGGFTKIAEMISEDTYPAFAEEYDKFKMSKNGSSPGHFELVECTNYNIKEIDDNGLCNNSNNYGEPLLFIKKDGSFHQIDFALDSRKEKWVIDTKADNRRVHYYTPYYQSRVKVENPNTGLYLCYIQKSSLILKDNKKNFSVPEFRVNLNNTVNPWGYYDIKESYEEVYVDREKFDSMVFYTLVLLSEDGHIIDTVR
jgi:hypothetical protein